MPRKLSKQHELDLNDAAYHEAAHAVIAHAAGFRGMVCIRLNARTNAGPEDTLVAGNAAFGGPLSKTVAAIVAWAGDIAAFAQSDIEVLDDPDTQDDLALAPSPSDQVLIDQIAPRLQRRIRRDAWKAVCDNWTEIIALAEQLIADYRETRDVQHWVQPRAMQRKIAVLVAEHNAKQSRPISPRRRGP
jgi:hypothetical protein